MEETEISPPQPDAQDDEWEESEFFVLLELDEEETLDNCKQYSVVGLDTATPFLTIDDKVYRGRHDEVIGTSMFFEEHRQPVDPAVPNGPSELVDLTLLGKTIKKIKFERVTLESKAAVPGPNPSKLPYKRDRRGPIERLIVKRNRSTPAEIAARSAALAPSSDTTPNAAAARRDGPPPRRATPAAKSSSKPRLSSGGQRPPARTVADTEVTSGTDDEHGAEPDEDEREDADDSDADEDKEAEDSTISD